MAQWRRSEINIAGGQGELSCSTAVLLWKTECNQLLAMNTFI